MLDMSMSLDGYVADESGSSSVLYPGLERIRETAELQELIAETGAVLMGRRAYEMGVEGGYEDYEYDVPIVVLTHEPPTQPARGRSFTFVTDGAAAAVAAARRAAGPRGVTIIGGASLAQQCLKEGLIDEIRLRLAPVVLGGGLRLFEDGERLELEPAGARAAPPFTNVRFSVA